MDISSLLEIVLSSRNVVFITNGCNSVNKDFREEAGTLAALAVGNNVPIKKSSNDETDLFSVTILGRSGGPEHESIFRVLT